mgnify:CR=1 FL=1|tara:strand:- start:207 stop:578 length:372 start_codon:yes stop_codon:yes gene_type:complete
MLTNFRNRVRAYFLILSNFTTRQNPIILKIKGFRLKQNSTFKYIPRYSKEDMGENVYKFDSRFSKYREITHSSDIRGQWKAARSSGRNKGNREINRRLLIIIAILVFIVLWIFDFDLSIFYSN